MSISVESDEHTTPEVVPSNSTQENGAEAAPGSKKRKAREPEDVVMPVSPAPNKRIMTASGASASRKGTIKIESDGPLSNAMLETQLFERLIF